MYVNSFAYGCLVVSIFTIFLGIFFLLLKNKSKSTIHLGLGFFFMGIFNFAYFFSAVYYNPLAAFHRWITVGIINIAIIHFTQFLLRYPENVTPRLNRTLWIIQYTLNFIVFGYFAFLSLKAPYKFLFTSHAFDFDLEGPSKFVGIFIFSYIIVCSLAGFYRIFFFKFKERWISFAMVVSLLIASAVPAFLNVLSRDGVVTRGFFLNTFVILTIIGFFLLSVLYINTTQDRTTFMVKIVGISLVTFLLILQILSVFTLRDKEDEYDQLHLEYAERTLEGGKRNEAIEYIYQYDLENYKINKMFEKDIVYMDFKEYLPEASNTYFLQATNALDSSNFRQELLPLLEKTPPEFQGYKKYLVSFLNGFPNLEGEELKKNLFAYLQKINKDAFVARNRISNIQDADFCKSTKAVEGHVKNLIYFQENVQQKLEQCSSRKSAEVKESVLELLSPLQKDKLRIYRKSHDEKQHFVGFLILDLKSQTVTEVGYSYRQYRSFISPSATVQMYILFATIGTLLILFPFFFRGALINPLNDLLSGVEKVNDGDLDVVVPIKVKDEVGFLADSFNSMVTSIKEARKELQDYAETLEDKVKERTKEVQEKMDEVHALKVQQDGDYFLTSLLAKPLFFNANKSDSVKTDFIIKQKKKFEFRKKEADLGGDICITGNLRLGTEDNFKRYIMLMNGDAMGKSMQGAGGCLVMGVIMNSIMARSARNNRIMNTTPERWLTEIYDEVNGVFKSFNGTMVISVSMFLVEEQTGKCFYFNAEHPYSVLYRDGKASFIENDLQLRKLGLDSEIPFDVKTFQLEKGDVLILSSDGRDDIDLTPDEDFRTINEDENLFLRVVEEGKGNVEAIEAIIRSKGEITDDFSILRLGFQENEMGVITKTVKEKPSTSTETDDFFTLAPEERWDEGISSENLYEEGRKLYKEGKTVGAIEVLYKAYKVNQTDQKINRLLGLLSYKEKDYQKAVEVLKHYLHDDENQEEFWYYLSISEKKLGKYKESLEAALHLNEINPSNFSNLLNIADLYRILGDAGQAKLFAERAERIDPENKNIKKLNKLLT